MTATDDASTSSVRRLRIDSGVSRFSVAAMFCASPLTTASIRSCSDEAGDTVSYGERYMPSIPERTASWNSRRLANPSLPTKRTTEAGELSATSAMAAALRVADAGYEARIARATRFSAGVSESIDSRIRCSSELISGIGRLSPILTESGKAGSIVSMVGLVTSDGLARAVMRRAGDELPLALADLEAWVASDSPSDDAPALEALARDIAARLERYGASVATGGGYLRATLTGSGRAKVALLGHHDTVFPAGTAAERPFGLDGDTARGPGVADMKGGLVVGAHVMRLLAGHRDSFAWLELVSAPDEELRDGPFDGIESLRG